jgi:6-pyruvoyltetrahydropterin/6-carboxytetrahydropterin synthase
LEVTKVFSFDAAHFLPNYNGACANIHGHTFKLEISLTGTIDKNCMVCDFKKLKNLVEEIILERLDHTILNDIIENPTAENLVIWIAEQLLPFLNRTDLSLTKIILWETPTSFVTYYL